MSTLYAGIAELGGERVQRAIDFLDALRDGADPIASYPQLDVGLRYQTRYAAVVLLGSRAPEAWRREAARALFIGERGYLAGT